MIRRIIILAILGLAAIAVSSAAQSASPRFEPVVSAGGAHPEASDASQPSDDEGDKKPDKESEDKDKDSEKDEPRVTHHEITVDAQVLPYRATAGVMPMEDEDGKLKAKVFFIAYEKTIEAVKDEGGEAAEQKEEKEDKDTVETAADQDPSRRPLTFVFNGGPGAAAVWLHLGTVGPRCIELEPEGLPPAPPYRLIDNANTWLTLTDVVFIDPVGTGYSRPAKGEKREQFYGVQEDVRWVADFIRLYTTKYERWLSPLFLAGESYGTTRAAGLSEHLLDRYGIALNGIVLVSTVLDFQTLRPEDGNDLPYPLFLPTYTAAAWYHRRLNPALQDDLARTLKEVEGWALGEYMTSLARGSDLGEAERRAIVQRLARYTSLPPELVDKSDLRITPWAFRKHLLGDQRKVIGRFDARIAGFDPDPTASWATYDPSLSRYFAVYSATFNDYVRRVLKYESVLPYEILSDKVRPWKFGEDGDGYLSVSERLRAAMVKNPHLKILFASGYFDLATPHLATEYTIRRMALSPELRANMIHEHYMGGHMMYHNQQAQEKLKQDVTAFMQSALEQGSP